MRRSRGMALIAVLVVSGILAASIAALVRSTFTTSRTAGNVAFRQGATQVAEVSLSAAEQYVNAITAADTSVANRYFATMQTTDASELPTTVNWTNVPTTTVGSYSVQWVVERMCTVTPVTDALTQCMTVEATQMGSQRAGAPSYQAASAVFYRVTARVLGPRNTESYVQTAVSR